MICGCFRHVSDIRREAPHTGNVPNIYIINDCESVDLQNLLGKQLCVACAGRIKRIEPPICLCCGMMFNSKEGAAHLCGDCIASPKMFRMARAPVAFDQAFTDVIHFFKYKAKVQLAMPLGELMLAAFLRYWRKEHIDLVIPVPLHADRFKKRGFNQALLPVQNWRKSANRLNLECPSIQLERQALVRKRPTVPQTGLGRKQRLVNIKNAFGVREPEKIEGKRILLVDDVYTTGATADECARVLLNHGALYIDVLTLARAI